MPISRILVLDYHASLRTSLFPKTKRRVRTFFPFSLSLFIFILFLGREGGGWTRRSDRVGRYLEKNDVMRDIFLGEVVAGVGERGREGRVVEKTTTTAQSPAARETRRGERRSSRMAATRNYYTKRCNNGCVTITTRTTTRQRLRRTATAVQQIKNPNKRILCFFFSFSLYITRIFLLIIYLFFVKYNYLSEVIITFTE